MHFSSRITPPISHRADPPPLDEPVDLPRSPEIAAHLPQLRGELRPHDALPSVASLIRELEGGPQAGELPAALPPIAELGIPLPPRSSAFSSYPSRQEEAEPRSTLDTGPRMPRGAGARQAPLLVVGSKRHHEDAQLTDEAALGPRTAQPVQPLPAPQRAGTAATLTAFHRVILDDPSGVRAQEPVNLPPRTATNPADPDHVHAFVRPNPSAFSKAAADRVAFMRGVEALPRILNYGSRDTAGFRALVVCKTFEEVVAAIESLTPAERNALLTAAKTLLVRGHETAGRMLAAMWMSFGAKPVNWSIEDVLFLLPRDGNGQPAWPAALGEDLRLKQIGVCRSRPPRAAVPFRALAEAMLNNPEPGA
jgi:hypothetical protein